MVKSDGGKAEAESLRRIVFVGVAFTTLAAMSVVVLVPIVYSHIQALQTGMESELEFCRLRSINIGREVTRAQVISC